MNAKEYYFNEFENVKKQLPESNQPWLVTLRQEAANHFAQIGFPTAKQESWKYTRVTALEQNYFTPSSYTHTVTHEQIKPFLLDPCDNLRLVFINGHFDFSLSNIPAQISKDAVLTPLKAAFTEQADDIQSHFSQANFTDTHNFTVLNTTFLNDGAFLKLANHTIVEKPIHLLFVSTTDEMMISPRNVIIAGKHSQACIIEQYVSLTNNRYFTNTVTEIKLDDNARIEHIKLQQESVQAIHIGSVYVSQSQNSQLHSHVFTTGGLLGRSDTHTKLLESGAACSLNGLYFISGQQHTDHHTSIDHAQPHCESIEHYKGVMNNCSRAVFNGKVIVRKEAQKTRAQQSNQNLLLSKEAEINTKPQLEIYADDVKCSHGATIGQLDESALFYLRSRGITENVARHMLIEAFAEEMLDKIQQKTLIKPIMNAVMSAKTESRKISAHL